MTRFEIQGRLQLAMARVELVRFDHDGPCSAVFRRDDVYWVSLSLTPRQPDAQARYLDRWGPHRYGAMGPLIVIPPGERLHLLNGGGPHTALVCQLHAEAVQRWLPDDFEWTDRRLEACLDVANAVLRGHLVRLAQELRHVGLGRAELAEAISLQVPIELARYLVAIAGPAEQGGLASWRLRAIDQRLAEDGPTPTLVELAGLCRMSVRQLTRGFRTSRGCSVGDYVTRFRIESAKGRLTSDESIKTIACTMGFASSSAFSYAFRRATGATPRQFRTRVLSGGDRTQAAGESPTDKRVHS